MELLRMHFGEWHGRRPDWIAAAVAGFLAGAVLMVLEGLGSLWLGTSVAHGDPWLSSRMLAAMVLGSGVLESTGFSLGVVVLALVIHYLLGIVFGLMLAVLVTEFHGDAKPGVMEFIGAAFGTLLYLFNFYIMSFAFPWFAQMRGWSTFMAHLVFGISAALLYWKLSRVRTLA
jgi:hypothetical protein